MRLAGTILVPILQMMKLRYQEVKLSVCRDIWHIQVLDVC